MNKKKKENQTNQFFMGAVDWIKRKSITIVLSFKKEPSIAPARSGLIQSKMLLEEQEKRNTKHIDSCDNVKQDDHLIFKKKTYTQITSLEINEIFGP